MMLRVISLGAGVQSTTMALMAAHGEIGPMPDCAIFADTGAEPETVYEHLRWLMSDGVLPFPVHIVSAGDLRAEITGRRPDKRHSWGRPPFYVSRSNGKAGLLNRQCTKEYKITPIRRKLRELLGLKPRQHPKGVLVEQWIGISLDEAIRARPSRDAWSRSRFPLLELRLNRRQCVEWLDEHGYALPSKSACTFCPFRDDNEWRRMKRDDPAAWTDAVAVDRIIRANMPGMTKGEVFVHRSRVPLDEVDLSTPEERGQLNMFLNECEGEAAA